MIADDHPWWSLAGFGGERLRALSPELQRAVLRQFELHASRRVAVDLARLLEAPWWPALPLDDRVRAVRVVAHVSARASGARRGVTEPCARAILDNTLHSLLPPRGRFGLRFEPLPLGEGVVVAGMRVPPDTVVLNRRAIAAGDARLGQDDPLEARVGLATLVHEVNHLHNLTPVGPTYEAFQDEYRAWLVDFVAHVGHRPRRGEALARCLELLTSPPYAVLQPALEAGSEHGPRIWAFLRELSAPGSSHGSSEGRAVERPQDLAALRCDDPFGEAPLPRPPGNLDNAPSAAPGPWAHEPA